MNANLQINDERIRNYTIRLFDRLDGRSTQSVALDEFKGKKSELPQEIVVPTNPGQQVYVLEAVVVGTDGHPAAMYRFDGNAYRKWFTI